MFKSQSAYDISVLLATRPNIALSPRSNGYIRSMYGWINRSIYIAYIVAIVVTREAKDAPFNAV